MEMFFGYRGANTACIILSAVAVLLVSAPASAQSKADARSAKVDARSGACSDTLKDNYGVAEFSDFSVHGKNNFHSIYATAIRAGGETIRVRCLFRLGAVHAVQVYLPGAPRAVPFSSKLTGNWTSAESYRVKFGPDAASPAEPPREQERIQPAAPHRIQVD